MSIEYRSIAGHDGYEEVLEFSDPNVGLKGYIAIHNTNLGPALGGTRIHNYNSEEEALQDALLLSKAMTYKCAIAGMPFGGGKGVIIANPQMSIKEPLLKSYAQVISNLNGKFHTGEDVGLTESNVQYMLQYCPFFIGKSEQAGDPSPYAALSTFLCIKETLRFLYDDMKVKNHTFTIKGLGKTGSTLINMLMNEGATIKAICDINPEKTKAITDLYPGLNVVTENEIFSIEADVYCPCALGGDITSANISNLKSKIIAGTANNQLKDKSVADQLYKKGILHVPDYVSNSGGLIDVANELMPGGFNREKVMKTINEVSDTLNEILTISKKEDKSPDMISDMIAERMFTKTDNRLEKAISNIKSLFTYDKK